MDQETLNNIKIKLQTVPKKPGSYQMLNEAGNIIYVGKAKNLQNRLKSYFTKSNDQKTTLLVNEINDFEYIVTSSEIESLILEFNLIKKYNPKYNILLKDDKSYPYIEITNEEYPKLQIVRNIKRRKHMTNIFGPYPNVTSARNVVTLLNRIYPFRKCNSKPGEVCFYYHLGQCMCSKYNEFDKEVIPNMVKESKQFLNGNTKPLVKKLNVEMLKASTNMEYEKAQELKQTIADINITTEKQKLDLKRKYNADIFGYYEQDDYLSITVFMVREGVLFGSENKLINLTSDYRSAVEQYIMQFYENNPLLVNEIIIDNSLNNKLLSEYFKIKVNIYQKGDLYKLQKLVVQNAEEYLNSKLEVVKLKDEQTRLAMSKLNEITNSNIMTMEVFDNSHLFGTFYVGAMVVFNNFEKQPHLYRKYKINLDNIDDLRATKEVIYRRYFKLMMDLEQFPDLVVIDGGETHLNAVKSVFKDLNINQKVIALKKNNKHTLTSIIYNNQEYELDKHDPLYLNLLKVSEEVHRFVITYHRELKNKSVTSSILDEIKGLGPKRKKDLIKTFGSLQQIKLASVEQLNKVVPLTIAEEIYEYFKKEQYENN